MFVNLLRSLLQKKDSLLFEEDDVCLGTNSSKYVMSPLFVYPELKHSENETLKNESTIKEIEIQKAV